MEIRKVLNEKYLFVNTCTSNRYGFNHISTLFKGNYELGSAKVHYINRTWERYSYQTSMQQVIYNLIRDLQQQAIDNYKEENEILRLVKAKKEKVLKELEKNATMKEYRKIYKELENWV